MLFVIPDWRINFLIFLSTLVAFGNIATPTEFRNSMACAALPAMFNWLTVLVLLPLEMNFSMLEKITAAATQNLVQNGTESGESGGHGKSPIKAITKPLQQFIISIDKHGLGNSNYSGTFVKYCHERVEKCENFCDYGDKCDDLEGGEKACMQIRLVAFQKLKHLQHTSKIKPHGVGILNFIRNELPTAKRLKVKNIF